MQGKATLSHALSKKRGCILFGILLAVSGLTPLGLPANAAQKASGQARVVLIDLAMRHPEVHEELVEALTRAGAQVRYRRFYPRPVQSDAQASLLILAAGAGEQYPSAHLGRADAAFAADYARRGGTLLLLASDTDVAPFNAILAQLDAPIRIGPGRIMDGTHGYPSTLLPSSYFKNLPYLKTVPAAFAGGVKGDLLGGHESPLWTTSGALVPLVSYPTSESLVDPVVPKDSKNGQMVVTTDGTPPQSRAAVALARVGRGVVAVASRGLFNLDAETGRTSDKPAIPVRNYRANHEFVRHFLAVLLQTAAQPETLRPLDPVAVSPLPAVPTAAPETLPDLGPLAESPPSDSDDSLAAQAEPELPPWIRRQKIRAGYLGAFAPDANQEARNVKVARLFHATGLNTMIGMLTDHIVEELQAHPQTMRAAMDYAARRAKREGLYFFYGSYFPLRPFRPIQYNKLMDAEGHEYPYPSAFDDAYWEQGMFTPAREMAASARRTAGADGLFWDFEMYEFPGALFREALGFEDVAYLPFFEHPDPALPAALVREGRAQPGPARFAWLRDHGLFGAYERYLEGRAETMGRKLRAEVDRIAPRLLPAFYMPGLSDSWFYRGFFRGVSSPRRPVIIFTYEARGLRQKELAAQEGIVMLHCPGVLMNSLGPRQWIQSLPALATAEDGYWLFPFDVLTVSDADAHNLTNDSTLSGLPSANVQGIRAANRRLDQLLAR